MAKRKTTKKATQNNKINTQSCWADGDLDPRLPSLEGNAGKVPVIAEDEKGFEYKEVGGGGTKLYEHTLQCTTPDGSSNFTYYLISTYKDKLSAISSSVNIILISGIITPLGEQVLNAFNLLVNLYSGKAFFSISGNPRIIVNDNVGEI